MSSATSIASRDFAPAPMDRALAARIATHQRRERVGARTDRAWALGTLAALTVGAGSLAGLAVVSHGAAVPLLAVLSAVNGGLALEAGRKAVRTFGHHAPPRPNSLRVHLFADLGLMSRSNSRDVVRMLEKRGFLDASRRPIRAMTGPELGTIYVRKQPLVSEQREIIAAALGIVRALDVPRPT